jgi:hypothetical protein
MAPRSKPGRDPAAAPLNPSPAAVNPGDLTDAPESTVRRPGRQGPADTTAFSDPADQWTGAGTSAASATANAAGEQDMADTVADQAREATGGMEWAEDPQPADPATMGDPYTPDTPELTTDTTRVRWTGGPGGWRYADFTGPRHREAAMDRAHDLMRRGTVGEVKVDSCYPGDRPAEAKAFDPREGDTGPSLTDFWRDFLKRQPTHETLADGVRIAGPFTAEELAGLGRRAGKSGSTAEDMEAVAKAFGVPPGLLAVDRLNRERLGLGAPLESLFGPRRGAGVREACGIAEAYRMAAEASDEEADEARADALNARRESFWTGSALVAFVALAGAMEWWPSMADNLYHGQVVTLGLASAALAYLKRPTAAVVLMFLAVGLAL